jgi:15-cis-phytoene synthase
MGLSKNTGQNVWDLDDWTKLERRLRANALGGRSEKAVWRLIAKEACKVMKAYTTSFFIVSRFLPSYKRAQVEIIYSAVRFPDEIVDTFPFIDSEKMRLLDEWQNYYEIGLRTASFQDSLKQNVPCFLAAFTKVIRENSIPAEFYRSFLDAMRRDIRPRPFSTLEDLTENYIYGSAVVVGYFLTYVYGSKTEKDFDRAMRSARSLGIALQLTNFLRDVSEDQSRGRIYLPVDMLREEGIENLVIDDGQHDAFSKVIRRMASIAENHYRDAQSNLDAFAPDCRTAIRSCIEVYRRLNERIAEGGRQSIQNRESVPLKEKFRVLPISKYWRIPFAYLTR